MDPLKFFDRESERAAKGTFRHWDGANMKVGTVLNLRRTT